MRKTKPKTKPKPPSKASILKLFSKAKWIKYEVTDAFGDHDIGDILPAILLVRESDSGLVYHPASKKGECGSLEFCVYVGNGIWEARDRDTFLNLG